MEPRFLGDGDGIVVVLFRHRAWNSRTQFLLDTPEVGIYQLSGSMIRRSDLILLDLARALAFLAPESSSP
jgi:hypothetical protein